MAETQLILETLVKGTAEARKSLDSITKGLDDLGKSTKKVDTLGDALKKNSEGFATIGKAAGVAFTGIVALGTGAVVQAGKLQDLRQQFDTLLGSAEKGKTLFLEIQKMAALTPFTSSDLASATSTMLGFGVAEEKVLPLMKQLGDISMGNSSRFQLLSLAFSQMSATGRLMGQDLNQMINAGFNPLQEIAKKTGKSIGQLKEEMADGAISAKMVEDAMASATGAGGRFEGGMVKASKTFSGVMSTFKDNIQITLAALGGFANGEVIQGGLLDTLTKMMENLMPKLDQFTQWTSNNPEMAKNILLVVGALAGLITAVVGIGFAVMPVVTAVKSLMSIWSILGLLWSSVILPGAVALGTAIAAISAPVWIVIGVIAALIAAGVALYKNWDTVKNFLAQTWEVIKQIFSFGAALVAGITIAIFDAMGIDIVAVWNNLVSALGSAWAVLKGIVSAGMAWLASTFNLLAAPVKAAWGSMWETMSGTVTSVWDTVKNTIVSSMNWIIDKINFVITMANKVAKMGSSAIGVKIISLPTIPRLAEGGIVKARPGGVLANIGEGGQDEAVIPLNKMKNMGGIGGGITINFTGTFGKDAARSIGDTIMMELARAGAI